MQPDAAPSPSADPYERYRRMLAEAEAVHGVSLWQDAWKRLRRNRAAMFSLGFLILLGLAAFFTPLIPLQSPILLDLRNNKFAPPNFKAVRLELEDHERNRVPMSELLRRHREEADADSTAGERFRSHPSFQFWHKPGAVTRLLIDFRMQLFGDYALPSLCGNDELGRDVLSRLFWGSRVSILVGLTATFVSLLIGVAWGATAGYLGGTVDSLMMRFVDTMYAIPFLFIVIFIMTILSEPSMKAALEKVGIHRIIIFYAVIGAFYWLTMSRVVRGQVISLKNEQFVDAARTIGAGTPRIIFRHLIPNVLGIVIVYLTLTIPSVMLFEAVLSFLGLGVEPPDVSWGLMANEGVRVVTPVKSYWWIVVFPSGILSLTLFALNFLGDGLRDALDPRLKNR